ncbi:hypothetical protein LTR96_000732 [Exophiala xenobiotica]|uniref:Cytochrome P450 n=1 Tax=Vermiconidia calcicola TaxID=1690605 RepID=A0AAV9QJD9_9PEZI|nr:hypothetical protein LTR96_000732 [Exophiala xenobiotica]KAK5343460.1 hypothetical protein LTR98_001089 [Exophiala xenobiotica]KAK5543564.1 hypothetical protein LTR25_001178 [Vermiconidia calcicola]KAK5548227.1 hypothetical protein LTR23_001936 [Chaetothyriales sp. CCFEE 6169]
MIWTSLTVLVLCTLGFLYNLARRPNIHRNGHKLRHPPDTLPLLGNAIQFLKPRHVLFDWFFKCQQLFGSETFEISVPTLPPGVVINSPENLEFVLKNESAITKGEFFKERSWDLFGHGIINATGDLWRAQRKAGLKFFSGANLDALVEEVLPEVYEATTRKHLLQASQDGSIVDLQKVFLDLTTTVVGHMAYDRSLHTDTLLAPFKMEISASSPFSKAFDHASSHVGLRFQNPLYRLTELFTGADFRSSLAEVKRFGRQIVANARKRRSRAAFESLITDNPLSDPSGPSFGTLIDSLIEAFADPQVVADAALNFLSAGRDTTAQSFTWTFYALLRHSNALNDVRDEINANVKDLESIEISHLQPTNLPLTLATFYEALRLYPPVPFEIKQTNQPVTLPDGTFLPPSAIVVWCIYALNRSRDTFGDDAHLFRPRRWLDDEGKFVGKSPFEFPVFNGGPRACLGKKMAEVMGVWVMVRFCSEWEFEEVTDGTVKVGEDDKTVMGERVSANSLTLPMEGGMPCRVKVR